MSIVDPAAVPPTPPPSSPPAYPVNLNVDYPESPRNRVTVFFRAILAIPVVILLELFVQYSSSSSSMSDFGGAQTATALGGFIFLPTLLLLLFRHRYPRWWFDFNVQLLAFVNRVGIYVYLLRDEYPSTEDRQALNLRVAYPNAKEELSRGLPLIKWLLVIPHYIVLFFLGIGLLVVTIIAWFAILFTGRYPRGLFDYTVGVMRWSTRVSCYAILLTTDKYPPFRLGE
ncbi:MAG: DUF4389 domain-containing protein [Thermoleophilia bacterium]|jgi:hypothetical protein